MGAELATAAAYLFDTNCWYAGAALLRQLIEVEYLLFLFSTDAAEADRWLKAPSKEAAKLYSPKNMRERSQDRFNAEEYSLHCEIGGHPRLKGSVLLKERMRMLQNCDENVELFSPSALWVDLGQHVERMWIHFSDAVQSLSPSNFYAERFQLIDKQIHDWHNEDPFPNAI